MPNEGVILGIGGLQDQEVDYNWFLTTRDVFPAGAGGECVFYALRVRVENISATTLDVTPILNGERQDTVSVSVPARYTAEPDTWIVEIPLVQKYLLSGVERLRQGQRGTFIRFEFAGIVSDGDQSLTVLEADIEYEVVRERFPNVVFFEDALSQPHSCVDEPIAFFGQLGDNGIGREGGWQDFGGDYDVRLHAHAVYADRSDGEGIYPTLYFLTTRNNASDVALLVTPYLDSYPLVQESVTLPAVSANPITDVHEVPVMIEYAPGFLEKTRYAPRGASFAFMVEVEGPHTGEIIFETGEIEFEVVRESRPAISV